MNEWTVQSIKGFIAEHKNSGSSYYEKKAKDIECLLNEYNGLIDRIYKAGYSNEEARVRINGRLFAVRELAQ